MTYVHGQHMASKSDVRSLIHRIGANAATAVLWEHLMNAEQNANYWRTRAERCERRMQKHDCQEES